VRYGVLRTADATSAVVSGPEIAFSLATFFLIYLLLFVVFVSIAVRLIQAGPADEEASR
jgi:cytochrome bd-type quinol oxidase subunit 1